MIIGHCVSFGEIAAMAIASIIVACILGIGVPWLADKSYDSGWAFGDDEYEWPTTREIREELNKKYGPHRKRTN